MNKKTVAFDLTKNKIKILHVYTYASHRSRDGSVWLNMSLDNFRFKKRINEMEKILEKILASDYRNKMYNERFVKNKPC